MKCFRPGCSCEGTAFPIIHFGLGGDRKPYRLEVPQTVCAGCQRSFDPFLYITPYAREKIDALLTSVGQPAPQWDFMSLDWGDPAEPHFAEIVDSGQGRVSWCQ